MLIANVFNPLFLEILTEKLFFIICEQGVLSSHLSIYLFR